jgi:hypothetical protein
MDIELHQPEQLCDKSSNKAHYFIQLTTHIWRCHYCWRPKWLPNTFDETVKLHNMNTRYGKDKALTKTLNRHPAEKKFMLKLEEIRLLKKTLPKEQFLATCAAIEAEHKSKRRVYQERTKVEPAGK